MRKGWLFPRTMEYSPYMHGTNYRFYLLGTITFGATVQDRYGALRLAEGSVDVCRVFVKDNWPVKWAIHEAVPIME